MRSKGYGLAVFLASLLTLGAILELAYRAWVRHESRCLREEVQRAHSGARGVTAYGVRFGWETSWPPASSLAKDAWMRMRGLRENAYLMVILNPRAEPDDEQDDPHLYVWSPRRLRYVPWRHAECDREGCPSFTRDEVERRRRDRIGG